MSEKSLKPIIHSIFPTPIYTTKIDRGFTKQELQFVMNKKNIAKIIKVILIPKIITS
jgi:hypothetical protein